MKYRPDDFYAENGCEVLYGVKATAIDCGAKTIALDNGESLSYNELCVAAGSSPFVPPMKGLETVEKKFGFMTLDDTLELEKAITPDSRVLIVGAGLIGLKCAEGICGRVAGITVCDLADRVLSSILDNASAAVVQRKLEENGLLATDADKIDGEPRVIYFESGTEVTDSQKLKTIEIYLSLQSVSGQTVRLSGMPEAYAEEV